MAIRPYARDNEHAHDLHQDCWHAILERLDRYAGRGSFASWAIAVSRNVCRMHLRKAKREGMRESPLEACGDIRDSGADPEGELTLREQQRVLDRALAQLPARERDAIVLRVLEERSTAETAKALGVSQPGARALVARALTRLRSMEDVERLVMDWIE